MRDFKHSVYEGGLRVPFIMSWPGKLKPSVCDEPVISIDIMPTICASLDINLPSEKVYDGQNLLSAIQGKLREPLHKQLFFDGNDDSWAVREGKWKLLFSRKGNIELYNLDEDLSEQNNLALQYPDKVAALKTKYTKWRNEMGTPMSKKKKNLRKKSNAKKEK